LFSSFLLAKTHSPREGNVWRTCFKFLLGRFFHYFKETEKSLAITMEFNQNQIENLETTVDFLEKKFCGFEYKDGKIKKRRKEVLFLI